MSGGKYCGKKLLECGLPFQSTETVLRMLWTVLIVKLAQSGMRDYIDQIGLWHACIRFV